MTREFPSAVEQPAQLHQNVDSVLEVQKRESQQRSTPHRFIDHISRRIGQPLYFF